MAVRPWQPWIHRLIEGGVGTLALGMVVMGAGIALTGGDVASDAVATGAVATGATTGITETPTGESAATGWVTSPADNGRRLAPLTPSATAPTRNVTVDLADRRQTWVGAGAALTDSSVELLDGNTAALAALFAPNAEAGARLDLVRLPLSATDFSRTAWTWEWNDETGRARPTPEAERAIDLLAEIDALTAGDLAVLAAPWTAPDEFVAGGTGERPVLVPGAEAGYARMLATQAEWLVTRGVPLRWLSLGNEPGHAADYPTLLIDDDQLVAMADDLAPALRPLGVDLLAVDHNWADRDRVDRVLAAAPGGFGAAAFHCYDGQPAAMAGLAVPAIVTECTGTSDTWAGTFAWDIRHLVEQSVEHGSTGLVMWNLALDGDHGPKRDWGCADCRGLLTIDPSTGTIQQGPEFYVLAHLGRAAVPGATVLGTTTDPDVSVAAFEHADGTIGLVGHNAADGPQSIAIGISDGRAVTVDVDAGDLFTVQL